VWEEKADDTRVLEAFRATDNNKLIELVFGELRWVME
jgi:hypothetical protein